MPAIKIPTDPSKPVSELLEVSSELQAREMPAQDMGQLRDGGWAVTRWLICDVTPMTKQFVSKCVYPQLTLTSN